MHTIRRHLLVVLVLIIALAPAAAAQEGPAGDDAPASQDINVLRTDAEARDSDGIDVAIRLSQLSHPSDEETRRVVLASADTFADALSASGAQADGPLLLTDRDALPLTVHAELVRLDPQEVLLLGGEAAISPEVEAAVADLGLRTTRIAGPSRIETSVTVAGSLAPTAEGAILVRAYDADGGDGSAAWADSVTAGALALETGWPILLTETAALSAPTEAYLSQSPADTVVIVGGHAAVSDGVQRQLLGQGYFVERIAGNDRVETALGVAAARGLTDADRIVLVPNDGDLGWQAGIAVSRHAAAQRAAILPVGEDVPAGLTARLASSSPAGVTCVVAPSTCQQVRALAGLGSMPEVSYHPAPGSALSAEEFLVVQAEDPHRQLAGEASVASDCTISSVEYLPESSASFSLSPDTQEEPGGDQPPAGDGVDTQPHPGVGQGTGPVGSAPTQPMEPIEVNEPAPADAPLTTCVVTTTFERVDGGVVVDTASFHVVDLRPRIRVTTAQVEGSPVTFMDRSDGFIDSWSWAFGDGADSTERQPVHTYDARGCYDVQLTVTSPLVHWLTSRHFQETEIRTIAVDPDDTGATQVELLVIDAGEDGARVFGEDIMAFGPQGATRGPVATGGDGRAVFDDLTPGTWVFNSVQQPDATATQQVIPGSTLCPALVVGPVGDLSVTVLDGARSPISGATVSVLAGEELAASGLTDVDGHLMLDNLPVGEYEVVASLGDTEIGRRSASVNESVLTEVVVRPPEGQEGP